MIGLHSGSVLLARGHHDYLEARRSGESDVVETVVPPTVEASAKAVHSHDEYMYNCMSLAPVLGSGGPPAIPLAFQEVVRFSQITYYVVRCYQELRGRYPRGAIILSSVHGDCALSSSLSHPTPLPRLCIRY